MALRTLYLRRSPGANGHDCSEPKLIEEFRARSEDCLVTHRVRQGPIVGEIDPRLAREMISEELLQEFDPNLIYLEGGLLADERGAWKIDWPIVEDVVDRGGVLILADCGARELCRHRPQYEYAARFLRARAQFTLSGVVHGADRSRFWKQPSQILCRPEKMTLSDWLRPCYNGVEEVLVGDPAHLAAWQDIAGSGNSDTSMVVEPRGDGQHARKDPFIFASTARCGLGHVAFIAGRVSDDELTRRCPGNIRWLANLAELLAADALRNRPRSPAGLRSPFTLFLSHRSVNSQLVARLATAVQASGMNVLDGADPLAPADSLVQDTRRAIASLTHFVQFWSRGCLAAPWVASELPKAAALLAERRLPLLVVRLDDAPLPSLLSELFRIEAMGMSPQEIGDCLVGAVRRVARLAGR